MFKFRHTFISHRIECTTLTDIGGTLLAYYGSVESCLSSIDRITSSAELVSDSVSDPCGPKIAAVEPCQYVIVHKDVTSTSILRIVTMTAKFAFHVVLLVTT
jgi:hypothetical protein